MAVAALPRDAAPSVESGPVDPVRMVLIMSIRCLCSERLRQLLHGVVMYTWTTLRARSLGGCRYPSRTLEPWGARGLGVAFACMALW
eukprot:3967607-Amphidinium_carterae.1